MVDHEVIYHHRVNCRGFFPLFRYKILYPSKSDLATIHPPVQWVLGNILARCTNFCKPLKKKKNRSLSVQPGLRGSNDLCVGRKMATSQISFQSREQVVVRRGQIRKIGWVIKILEDQVGQFLLGCKWPVSRRIVTYEQDHLGDLPAAFLVQNILQLHQQR